VNAETWAAIAAALIALAALYFSRQSTRSADRAARAAEEQTKVQTEQTEIQREQTRIQEQLRIDAAQPYVWADIRPDDSTGTLLNLVIGNSGPTVARNVRVVSEPALPTIDPLREDVEDLEARLAEGIQSLAPGRSMSWALGQGFNLIGEDGRQIHILTITAEGPFGPIPPLSYAVDISDWRNVLDRPSGSLHQLASAVKELTKEVKKRTKGSS
jgi:hypothetical protein